MKIHESSGKKYTPAKKKIWGNRVAIFSQFL